MIKNPSISKIRDVSQKSNKYFKIWKMHLKFLTSIFAVFGAPYHVAICCIKFNINGMCSNDIASSDKLQKASHPGS